MFDSADHYRPRHRGHYRPELGWWPELSTIRVRSRHRACGDAVRADPDPVERPRPRLRWRDIHFDIETGDED